MKEKIIHVYDQDAKALKEFAPDQDVASALHLLLLEHEESKARAALLDRLMVIEDKLKENSEAEEKQRKENNDALQKISEQAEALKQMGSETLLYASKARKAAEKTAVRVKAMSMESSASAEVLSELAEVSGVGDVMIGTESPIWKRALEIVRQHIELAKSKKEAGNND